MTSQCTSLLHILTADCANVSTARWSLPQIYFVTVSQSAGLFIKRNSSSSLERLFGPTNSCCSRKRNSFNTVSSFSILPSGIRGVNMYLSSSISSSVICRDNFSINPRYFKSGIISLRPSIVIEFIRAFVDGSSSGSFILG